MARTGRRVEGTQVDAIPSRGHHDSAVTSRDVIAKLVLAMHDKLTGTGPFQCLYRTTLDLWYMDSCRHGMKMQQRPGGTSGKD
jgi:hypothetical protein